MKPNFKQQSNCLMFTRTIITSDIFEGSIICLRRFLEKWTYFRNEEKYSNNIISNYYYYLFLCPTFSFSVILLFQIGNDLFVSYLLSHFVLTFSSFYFYLTDFSRIFKSPVGLHSTYRDIKNLWINGSRCRCGQSGLYQVSRLQETEPNRSTNAVALKICMFYANLRHFVCSNFKSFIWHPPLPLISFQPFMGFGTIFFHCCRT